MVLNYGDYKKINENNSLIEEAFKKIDFYHLDDTTDYSTIREIGDLIEENEYRGIATFSHNIELFKDIDCTKIALVNYPKTIKHKRGLKNAIKKCFNICDEIEFPWDKKYINWSLEEWKELVLDASNNGIILRPMLECGILEDYEIIKIVNYLKDIGIYSFMTSTGLISEITTFDKWNSIKEEIPRIMDVKISGIISISDINDFIKSGADKIATSIVLKSNFKIE